MIRNRMSLLLCLLRNNDSPVLLSISQIGLYDKDYSQTMRKGKNLFDRNSCIVFSVSYLSFLILNDIVFLRDEKMRKRMGSNV